MKSAILFAFALTLVVAMVASTPIENSEDDFSDQTLISRTGEEARNNEQQPEGRKLLIQKQ